MAAAAGVHCARLRLLFREATLPPAMVLGRLRQPRWSRPTRPPTPAQDLSSTREPQTHRAIATTPGGHGTSGTPTTNPHQPALPSQRSYRLPVSPPSPISPLARNDSSPVKPDRGGGLKTASLSI